MKLILLLLYTLPVQGYSLDTRDSMIVADMIRKAEAHMVTHPDSCLYYAELVIRRANENGNVRQLGKGLSLRGSYFLMISSPDSSYHYYNLAADQFIACKDSFQLMLTFINKGLIHERKGEFEHSLKLQTAANEYFQHVGNTRHMITTMRSIARVYSLSGNHTDALPWFEKVHAYFSESGDTLNTAHAVSDLGTVHIYLGNYDLAKKYKLDALERFRRMDYAEALGAVYQALGNIDKAQGNFSQAGENYRYAIDYYERIDNLKGFGETYYNMGILEDTLGRTDEAIAFFRKSVEASSQYGDLHLQKLAYEKLSAASAVRGDYKSAWEAQVTFHKLSQQILDLEKQRNITEMQTRFETLQKDKEIEIQQNLIASKEYELLRNRQYLYATLSLFAIGILLFLFQRSRQRIRELQQKEAHTHEIQQQRMMAIIDSQEKERKRFTSDLHDSFGQMISLLKINIYELADTVVKATSDGTGKIQECKLVINEMYQELRNIVFDLMPQTLINGGIGPALREFAERLNRSGRIQTHAVVFGLASRLPQETETALYRICQEWVNNILKYSDAQQITLQITADDSELTLTIEDDGNGFDKELLTQGKGNGWKNMNSRAGLIGGKLEIETTPGISGNLLILNIPRDQAARIQEKVPA